MKRLLLLAILLFPVLVLAFCVYRGMSLHQAMSTDPAASSLAVRLSQYRPAARARLQPYFEAAQVDYPPKRVVLLALKREKLLEVYAVATNQDLRFIHAWPILAASGVSGPKLVKATSRSPRASIPSNPLIPTASSISPCASAIPMHSTASRPALMAAIISAATS